jgi:hypothetical protein
MELTVLDNIRKKFLIALNALGYFMGNFYNKKTRIDSTTPKDLRHKTQRKKKHKEIYNDTRLAYKGKGKINTDTTTFNHPRKDVFSGRQH